MKSIKRNINGWHNQPKQAERPMCAPVAPKAIEKPQQDNATVHTLL